MTTIISLRVKGKIDQDLVKKCKINPDYEYIGRRNVYWNFSGSFWANPFKPQDYANPEDCLKAYKDYMKKIIDRSGTARTIGNLVGKTLVCWCKPGPCHGDVLIQLLKEYGLE